MAWIARSKLPFCKRLIYLVLLLGSAYVLSIVWRVSIAEQQFFGSSQLIPLAVDNPDYTEPPVPHSYGSPAYTYVRNNKPLKVWKQEINGFQHVYGSALTAYEIGDSAANGLFCLNEYVDAVFDPDGISERDFKDRRKDLAHNQLGRSIGLKIRQSGVSGKTAEKALIQATLNAMSQEKRFFHHEQDPAILQLPSEAQLGCPGLPDTSLKNLLLK